MVRRGGEEKNMVRRGGEVRDVCRSQMMGNKQSKEDDYLPY